MFSTFIESIMWQEKPGFSTVH